MQLLQDEALQTQPDGPSASDPDTTPEGEVGTGDHDESSATVPDASSGSGPDTSPSEAGSGDGVESSAALLDGRSGSGRSSGADQMNGSNAKPGHQREGTQHTRRALVFVSEDTTADR